MFCRKCGKPNPENSNFCQHCGSKIETLSTEIKTDYLSQPSSSNKSDTTQNKMKPKSSFRGVKLSIAYLIIVILAGLGQMSDEEIRDAEITFLNATIIAIGIILYVLRKKDKLGERIKGSVFIEGILLFIIVVFLLLSILSGSWYENPLVFSVTPVWILFVYFRLFFVKFDNN